MFVLADHKINKTASAALISRGFEPIYMLPADYLQNGVSSHTDMLIFIGFGKLFCHQKYYANNKELIEHIASFSGTQLAVSDEKTGADYPYDVLFNACIVGKRLICNKKSVSKLIWNSAKEFGYEIISVPQGYTKCSVCVVSDNAIITADKAIAEACRASGIDTLLIREGYISLPPYNYGFIGGASGLGGDIVYFCGSLDAHPDCDEIKAFCEKHNKTAISLGDGELQDVGSLFFI